MNQQLLYVVVVAANKEAKTIDFQIDKKANK